MLDWEQSIGQTFVVVGAKSQLAKFLGPTASTYIHTYVCTYCSCVIPVAASQEQRVKNCYHKYANNALLNVAVFVFRFCCFLIKTFGYPVWQVSATPLAPTPSAVKASTISSGINSAPKVFHYLQRASRTNFAITEPNFPGTGDLSKLPTFPLAFI